MEVKIDSIKKFLLKNKGIAVLGILLVSVLMLLIAKAPSGGSEKTKAIAKDKDNSIEGFKTTSMKDENLSNWVKKTEKKIERYKTELEESNQEAQRRERDLQEEIRKLQDKLSNEGHKKDLEELERMVARKVSENLRNRSPMNSNNRIKNRNSTEKGMVYQGTQHNELQFYTIGQSSQFNNTTNGSKDNVQRVVTPKRKKRVKILPLGSHVQGTILTGVNAPADSNFPLPVLIRIDKVFTGPTDNKGRRSTLDVGKGYIVCAAQGDLTSQRALLQVTTLSAIRNGKYLEERGDSNSNLQNLGYVVGSDGILGVPGKIKKMSYKEVFKTSFLDVAAGIAGAFAKDETTTIIHTSGAISETTESAVNKSLWEGAESGFRRRAERQREYEDKFVPAIEIRPGEKVSVVILKGVRIEDM